MISENDENKYIIKTNKISKYKKTEEWIESSGELSDEEIAAVMYYDKIDTED